MVPSGAVPSGADGTGVVTVGGSATMTVMGSEALLAVLDEARRLGFLGPGPIGPQVDHALRYEAELHLAPGGDRRAPVVADLGAGGGLPALPLAVALPEHRFVLVEASAKRASFLVWAAVELEVAARVEVTRDRAEEFAHRDGRRHSFDAVVARGFGPPASTLECGAPLLRRGGRLVLSEPPGYRSFPEGALTRCGLALVAQRDGLAVFEAETDGDEDLPRSWRVQQRAPLF